MNKVQIYLSQRTIYMLQQNATILLDFVYCMTQIKFLFVDLGYVNQMTVFAINLLCKMELLDQQFSEDIRAIVGFDIANLLMGVPFKVQFGPSFLLFGSPFKKQQRILLNEGGLQRFPTTAEIGKVKGQCTNEIVTPSSSKEVPLLICNTNSQVIFQLVGDYNQLRMFLCFDDLLYLFELNFLLVVVLQLFQPETVFGQDKEAFYLMSVMIKNHLCGVQKGWFSRWVLQMRKFWYFSQFSKMLTSSKGIAMWFIFIVYKVQVNSYYILSESILTMSTPVSINQKRQQFRNELRVKQRQKFFAQIRLQLLEGSQQIQFSIDNLHANKHIQQTFKEIQSRINSPNAQVELQNMLGEGLIEILAQFINQKVFVKESLGLISLILYKQFKKIAGLFRRFYSHGILQFAVNNLEVQQLNQECICIIASFSHNHKDFCQYILIGNAHKKIIDLFYKKLGNTVNVDKQDINYMFYSQVLWTFDNLVELGYDMLEVEDQKKDIYEFSFQLLKRRIMMSASLGILTSLDKDLKVQIRNHIIPVINKLLEEAPVQANYFNNLFILVFKIFPVQINFKYLFHHGLMAKNLHVPTLFIMQRMVEQEFIDEIPVDQCWWEPFIQKFGQQHDRLVNMLSVVERVRTQKQWVWRFIEETLDPCNMTGAITRSLHLLHRKIVDFPADQQVDARYFLEKHGILNQLNALTTHNNTTIRERSSELLNSFI